MSSPDLKAIEDHIKCLIFKKNPDPPPPPFPNNSNVKYDRTSHLYNDKCLLANVENEVYKDKHTSGVALLDKSLNKNSYSSQLIDLNVLTNFAAKHADISEEISNATRTLPHPELDIDSTPSTSLSREADFTATEKNKSPGFRNSSKPNENSKANQIALKNLEDRCLSPAENKFQKKSKQTKRKIDKEKVNQKAQGENKNKTAIVAVSKQESIQSASKLKKQTSPSKSLPQTPKKKKESSPPQTDFTAPSEPKLPQEGMIYSLVRFKGYHRFLCALCDFEARSRDAINKHLNLDSHKEMKVQIETEKILPFLPRPLPSQSEAITNMLLNFHDAFGLQNGDLVVRQKLADRLKAYVECSVPGCTLEMIGSSAIGLGLKTSKVDFILRVDSGQNVPDSLELLYKIFHSDPAFDSVVSEFKQKRLGISFRDTATTLSCIIVLENGVSEKLAKLLHTYCQLDHRLPILGTVLRYWAKLCDIDNQDRGTLPAFSYSLLLIYFLQQVQPPVLPVMPELKEYSHANFYEDYIKGKKWKSENSDNLGELWIKFFHFYNFTYQIGKHVVCIRHSRKILCSDKNWTTKFYAIEDPFVRRNIAHVIPSFQIFQYIQRCFLRTYRYFAYPQLKKGDVKLRKDDTFSFFLLSECYASNKSSDEDGSDESDNDSIIDDFEDHDPDIPIENVLATLKELNLDENKTNNDVLTSKKNSIKADSPKKESKSKLAKPEEKKDLQSMCSWDVGNLEITVDLFCYKMDATTFKGKKSLPYSCKQCKSTDHTKKNCPKDELPARTMLPEMTTEYLEAVNKILYYIKDKHCIADEDRNCMIENMQNIEKHIRKHFPEANLSMFGSFCNGFGFKNRSDMDFCLTFKGQEDAKNLDSTEVIENLAKHLKQFSKLDKIVSVTSAKVPIVKFFCTESGLEGDISLYNTLAIANTEMLEAYSKIDQRVQILGFALKYFTKILGICDASRGSLSSYAYVLMVIFFLQQREPPVIPVLQELHTEEKPTQMIDDWNVWFFKDYDKLPEIWPEYGKNQESVGELWLNLLSFYAYDFDWKEYVVSIRQKAPLTRFRKLWITDQIAIEDPFDLNHNLGAGLSRKMNMYILKAFAKGRQRFGTPLPEDNLYSLNGCEMGYFFEKHYLNSGSEPPHDRGCRQCGKIGHIAKNCTEEKACICCKKTGHLIKNCPKKNKPKAKQKQNDRNPQDSFAYEKNPVQLESQTLLGHPLRVQQGREMRRNSQDLSKISEERKLVQMGYPTHRLPPPGFANSYNTPPPGFKPRFPMHPNGTSFIRNLPTPHSYPNMTMPDLSQSPPKHYNSSPPKNYAGNSNYHAMQEQFPPPMSIRSAFSPDPRHQPNSNYHEMQEQLPPPMSIRSALLPDPRHPLMWHNASQLPPNKFQSQYMDPRWKRTNEPMGNTPKKEW